MPTPTQQLLSRTLYATDGVTTVWDFSFAGGYLDAAHVKAYTVNASGFRVAVVITPAMLIGEFTLRISPALASGLTLTIYRDTPKDLPLVNFSEDTGFSEIALDTNAKQAIFVAAESADAVGETVILDLYAAATIAANAAAVASAAATAAAGLAGELGNILPVVFSGTGAQTVYTLPATPATPTSTSVTINGITQHRSQFTVVGTTLTFATAPMLGTNNIEVIIGRVVDNAPAGPVGPAGPQGKGIASIVRTIGTGAPGTLDTFTITYTDASTSTFQVYNGANGTNGTNGTNGSNGATGATGRGITSIALTSGSHAPGTLDTYTITYTDATTSTFQVYNGTDGAGSGTVTTLSVVSANGFGGTVANPTTNPAITLTTNVTGLVKGTGSALAPVVSGTDIKTVNGNSLLGSGDIVVSSGADNCIINGDMLVDQRNVGVAVTYSAGGAEQYFMDRWEANCTGTPKVSVQQVLDAPPGLAYSARILVTTSGTPAAGDFCYFGQAIEGINVIDLSLGTANAKPLVVCFWVKSSLTGSFSGSLTNSAGNRRYPFSFTVSAANTWEQKTATLAGDTTGTWLINTSIGLKFVIDLGTGSTNKGTAGAWGTVGIGVTGAVNLVATSAATMNITGVDVFTGTAGRAYRPHHIDVTLRACQRYCQVISLGNGFIAPFSGFMQSATSAYFQVSFKATMRGAADFSTSTQTNWSINTGAGSTATTALTLSNSTTDGCFLVATTSGQTIGYGSSLSASVATQTLTFTKEL